MILGTGHCTHRSVRSWHPGHHHLLYTHAFTHTHVHTYTGNTQASCLAVQREGPQLGGEEADGGHLRGDGGPRLPPDAAAEDGAGSRAEQQHAALQRHGHTNAWRNNTLLVGVMASSYILPVEVIASSYWRGASKPRTGRLPHAAS